MMVKFIINYLWHDADACSQIAKSVLKVLSSDGTCDGGASWFLLLLQDRVEYSCATLIYKLHNLTLGPVTLGNCLGHCWCFLCSIGYGFRKLTESLL